MSKCWSCMFRNFPSLYPRKGVNYNLLYFLLIYILFLQHLFFKNLCPCNNHYVSKLNSYINRTSDLISHPIESCFKITKDCHNKLWNYYFVREGKGWGHIFLKVTLYIIVMLLSHLKFKFFSPCASWNSNSYANWKYPSRW